MTVKDPAVRRDTLCAVAKCRAPLNETTLAADDPFCSTKCCHDHYGITVAMGAGKAEGGRTKGYIDKGAKAA